ncbi:hypothetical protein CW304_03885 [Bacillus sp. UFRGS-B20]|nr:hypothetical protein CW304_03885 [Bacillus sp. UFRGS-B20]
MPFSSISLTINNSKKDLVITGGAMSLRGNTSFRPFDLLVMHNAGLCKSPKYIPHFILTYFYLPMIFYSFLYN